jgi:hypothetical protein
MKQFTKSEKAALKRNAATLYPHLAKRDKLTAKIKELTEARDKIQAVIDVLDTATKAITNGFTTEELIDRVVTPTGKFKDGVELKETKFVFKYPDVLPPYEDNEESTENTEVQIDDTLDLEGQPAENTELDNIVNNF